jgi:MFS family permease
MWWISLSGALHNFNAYAVNQFMAAYLGRYHGMSLRQATTIAAFTLGAVGVVGLLGGGLVADWARRWRPNGRLLVGTLALFISTPCVYFALDRPAGAMVGFVVLMSVGWMLMYVYYVAVYPAIQDVIEPQLRGTAMALYFFAMYVIGGAFGTVVLGAVSDAMARRAMAAAGASAMTEAFKAAGLHSAFYIVPVVSLALTLVLFAASRTVEKDMARMQAWLRGQAAKAAASKN